jgi:hypothetical protein
LLPRRPGFRCRGRANTLNSALNNEGLAEAQA